MKIRIEFQFGLCESHESISLPKAVKLLRDCCTHGGNLIAGGIEAENGNFSVAFMEKATWHNEPFFVARVFGQIENLTQLVYPLKRLWPDGAISRNNPSKATLPVS